MSTQEQLAERYGISLSTLKKRLKRGIPLDAPLYAHSLPLGRPKGTAPVRACRCGHVHNVGYRHCPACNALAHRQ